MSKTDNILSKGQKLYENDDYILLWTKFFGLSLLALTSYYVYVKQKKRLIKMNSTEKTYLMTVSFYLTKTHGISPRSVIDDLTLFRDICQAVADRGGEAWKSYFALNSKDRAKSYVQQVPRWSKNKS